jgi:hypothetical protein
MVIPHGVVEAELRRLMVQQVGWTFGKVVHRVDERHWRIDGGAPSSLLVAIDSLMCKRQVVC